MAPDSLTKPIKVVVIAPCVDDYAANLRYEFNRPPRRSMQTKESPGLAFRRLMILKGTCHEDRGHHDEKGDDCKYG